MATVRVRDKHQITLPKRVVEAAGIAPDDTLEVTYANGVIMLTRSAVPRPDASARAWVGALRGRWGRSRAQIDRALDRERDDWDRH